MDLLPVEIVNEILLLVDRPSLYHVSQVCVQWRQISLRQVVTIEARDTFVTTCRRGDLLSIIRSKVDELWLNDGLYHTCREGHKELVELMILKGANDWNRSLGGSCFGGSKELAELMILKGANDLNYSLYYACEGGHKDLMELMILKGADDLNAGFYGACSGGHKELAELMVVKGANRCCCGKPISEH